MSNKFLTCFRRPYFASSVDEGVHDKTQSFVKRYDLLLTFALNLQM